MSRPRRLRACREAEANAYLSLTLTLASVLLLYVGRKLALTLSEREQLKLSQMAMLKQVGFEILAKEANRVQHSLSHLVRYEQYLTLLMRIK